MKRLVLLLLAFVFTQGSICRLAATVDRAPGFRRLSVAEYRDKMMAGWVGQMAGVTWGAPTEFKFKDQIIPADKVPVWKPAMINDAFGQDDLYVEMTFLRTLEQYGLNVSIRQAGLDFASSAYPLWCANNAGRKNLRAGIAPPDSSHPRFNKCPNDIDYQIEADYSGLVAPGLPEFAIRMGEKFGRLMNYGDGMYAGQFVGAMYAAAFFERDPVKIALTALKAIPADSQYAEMVRDLVAWYRADPNDWEKTWRLCQQKYRENPDYQKASNGGIDCKINGAYVLLGLLYGQRDPDRTITIAMRGGEDSDCNPSSAAGVLFTTMGFSNLPERFKRELNRTNIFSHTAYSFPRLVAVCEKLARRVVKVAGGKVTREGGEEVFNIPVPAPQPSKLELSWAPGPIANSRFTPAEMARIKVAGAPEGTSPTPDPPAAPGSLAKGFVSPPASARPWVYWFWLDGNITREGITADLEAMRRVGIGGVLIMEVDQGTPKGPARFASPQWRELFKFMLSEAHRLGLEVNMNNDAGWCGSGGPWITPALAMQKVVWSTTQVEGPRHFEGVLPEPNKVADYYEDIAVLAFPTPAEYRIANIQAKAAFTPQEVAFGPLPEPLPAEKTIPRDGIRELTSRMSKDGRLVWDVPPGKWTILRFGHTPTGKDNHPAPEEGRGLECDKLSPKGADAMFAGLMAKLIADSKPLAGKTLVATHIDSWEVGSQNWTADFRKEFRRLRGYDPLPFLPVMTGRVVGSLEVSERFLWDLRQTISQLLVKNYAGRFRELAHKHGMRLSIEAYGEPAEDMAYAGQADEPMGEFWSWPFGSGSEWCTEMSSAAHIYGKPILGAEAFTASNQEKWLGHPGVVKALGDWAFCEGINRFVFHRYALQPWLNVKPGISMGPWGLHYERTETWWADSTAWHEYLARCQFLLQQGQFVADVCYLEPEGSPHVFRAPPRPGSPPHRPGYNFDGCTPEVVLSKMKVKDGRLVLPSGMSYRVLVLPKVETMTPQLLRKIRELVKAGATVVGPAPQRSPSLTDYPRCDAEVQKLAREIWGARAGEGTASFGRGRVIWPLEEKPLKAVQEKPMRLGPAKWIWFKEGNPAVAAPVAKRYFRHLVVLGGARGIESARMVMTADNSFELWVNGERAGEGGDWGRTYRIDCKRLLKPGTNLLAVVVVNGAEAPNPAGLIGRLVVKYQDGRTVEVCTDRHWESATTVPNNWRLDAGATAAWEPAMELGALGMAPWGDVEHSGGLPQGIYPTAGAIADLMRKLGVPPDFDYVTQSSEQSLRYIHKRIGQTDVYFVANEKPHVEQAVCSFRVEGKRPELWWPDSGRMERVAVYDEVDRCVRVPIRFDASGSVFIVFRPGGDIQPARIIAVKRNGEPVVDLRGTELNPGADGDARIEAVVEKGGGVQAEIWQPGTYAFTSADGKARQVKVANLPEPFEITGPWDLRFPPDAGAPERVTLDRLISWNQHPDAGVRYFSGTATYHKTFEVPASLVAHGRRVYLDLGRVEVMARVKLNGKDLGVLWKEPYSVEVTRALKPGENTLEVQVVNLWVNRMIGDEQLPEDSDRNPNGTLKQWPQWLLDGKPSPTGRYTFTSWRLWQKDSPLVESGLLGPVKLRAVQSVMVR